MQLARVESGVDARALGDALAPRRLGTYQDAADVEIDDDVFAQQFAQGHGGGHTGGAQDDLGRAHPQHHLALAQAGQMRRGDARVAHQRVPGGQARRQHVHRRVAEKRRDLDRGRAPVDFFGGADLHDAPIHKNRQAIRHRHRLFLVMGDIDGGYVERALQAAQFHPGFHAQFRVQVRQGFVEQEQRGFAHDRARQGDALLLAARELSGPAFEQVVDAHARGGFAHRRVDLRLRGADHLQRKGDVVEHRHVRVQRIALKHHRHVAVAGRQERGVDAIEMNKAFGGRFQPCDDA